jgi:hypothetical protein
LGDRKKEVDEFLEKENLSDKDAVIKKLME